MVLGGITSRSRLPETTFLRFEPWERENVVDCGAALCALIFIMCLYHLW